MALLTREQELAALSARKILEASTSEVQLLERPEDALQQRIREEASKNSQRLVVDSEAHNNREDNSVKEGENNKWTMLKNIRQFSPSLPPGPGPEADF